jgi:hypothetical protein
MNCDSEGNLNRSAGSKDSGGNIRNQLHLEQGNAILQLQLSLFQPAQLQLVVHRVEDERIDHHIQVTMLDFQFDNALLYIFRMGHDHFVTFRIKNSQSLIYNPIAHAIISTGNLLPVHSLIYPDV